MSPHSVAESTHTSNGDFAEPWQTLIVFDWDDTLFPTTEIIDRWGISSRNLDPVCLEKLSEEKRHSLSVWEETLSEYLQQACSLSDRCVILTNARKPWVHDCINVFCPSLSPYIDVPGGPEVVYAFEQLNKELKMKPRLHVSKSHAVDIRMPAELDAQMSLAKYAALKAVTEDFYSQYPDQTWKNILSVGDMLYESNALKDVAFHRKSCERERLRVKILVVPTAPAMTEITLRLKISRVLLPAYVLHDGDFDLDLNLAEDPLEMIASALSIPRMIGLPLSRHAWSREPCPDDDHFLDGMANLAEVLHDHLISVILPD